MNGQVRITLIQKDFNKIVELTKNNNIDEKESNDFLNKIMTYSYVKDGKVTMNLYPSEARFLIRLLNENLINIEITKNWMEELIEKKEEYRKNKEGGLNA